MGEKKGSDFKYWYGLGTGIAGGLVGNLLVSSSFLLIEPIEDFSTKVAIYLISWVGFIGFMGCFLKTMAQYKAEKE